MTVLDDLRARRDTARAGADEILTRAATEQRDLSADEATAHAERTTELRALDDEVERHLAGEISELRAAQIRVPSGDDVQYRGGTALLAELRALTGSGVTGGGSFTPTQFSDYFFDRLAAVSVGLRSGMRVVRTSRDTLIVPRWSGDTTATWTAESGTITSTDATADQITATPRKLAGIQRISNEAVADSNPQLADIIAGGLVRAVGLKADLGFFEGSGAAPEIRGLKNVAGISSISMGTNGAALTTLDPFADAIGTLEQANTDGAAIVMHPRSWQALLKVKEVTGGTKPLMQEHNGSGSGPVMRSIYGVPVFLTTQLSITETQGTNNLASSAYVYDPSQVVVVVRDDVRVERDSSRLFNSDESEVRAITRLDMVVPNPAAVVRIAGII